MPKQKWRWAVFLKANCTKELSPEIYVLVKEGGAHQTLSFLHLLSPLVSLSLSLSLSEIRLAFTEMLLYLLFKRKKSEDCL